MYTKACDIDKAGGIRLVLHSLKYRVMSVRSQNKTITVRCSALTYEVAIISPLELIPTCFDRMPSVRKLCNRFEIL